LPPPLRAGKTRRQNWIIFNAPPHVFIRRIPGRRRRALANLISEQSTSATRPLRPPRRGQFGAIRLAIVDTLPGRVLARRILGA
jgi:hypothetical protein